MTSCASVSYEAKYNRAGVLEVDVSKETWLLPMKLENYWEFSIVKQNTNGSTSTLTFGSIVEGDTTVSKSFWVRLTDGLTMFVGTFFGARGD